MQQYFATFCDKACCFEDLKPFVGDLETSELGRWEQFLQSQKERASVSSTSNALKTLNVLKMERYSISRDRTEMDEYRLAMMYLKLYFEALPLGPPRPSRVEPDH